MSIQEHSNKRSTKYQRTKKGLTAKIYSHQRECSKKRGHCPPSYNLKGLREWVFSQPNFDTLFDGWVSSGYDKMLRPSCDRKDDYKPYTLDNLQLMSWQQNKDKGHSDIRNGINSKINKAVIQMTKLGDLVNRFHSAHEANRVTGISQGGISKCCLRKRKTAGGSRWIFEIVI